ncbi:MAG: hypothetical protein AAGA75_26005 [Cyanobacteria bacterium P01_E01_bin.6]
MKQEAIARQVLRDIPISLSEGVWGKRVVPSRGLGGECPQGQWLWIAWNPDELGL